MCCAFSVTRDKVLNALLYDENTFLLEDSAGPRSVFCLRCVCPDVELHLASLSHA